MQQDGLLTLVVSLVGTATTALVAYLCLRIKLAVAQLENRLLLLLQRLYVSKQECEQIRLGRGPLRLRTAETGLCDPPES
jgi:hypothetical protein